jgi:HAD superfamily hydrolase (TIGR01450 family)
MVANTWVIDLDGVMWCGSHPIDGSARAVEVLRAHGDHVLFATNHSAPTRADLLDALRAMGVACEESELFTSADAAATLVQPGESVLAVAAAGVRDAMTRRGAILTDEPEADVVVIGWHEHFTFDGLTTAVRAVLAGARLVATNDDRLRPGPSGPVPGCGALVACVETATSKEAVRAGKPHRPMADLLRPHLGGRTTVVGDSTATDGRLATRLGVRFALVQSGIDVDNLPSSADVVGRDFLDVVAKERPSVA